MRIVIQRVTEANVVIEGKINGEIGNGMMILVGIEESDSDDDENRSKNDSVMP